MAALSVDKDKIAKSALRYIQKGQFQRAIEEYRQVLASDPKDIRIRLKLVDLYGRMGKKKEAVEECLQVAESYSDQGFYLKAVAVYKQAVRIDAENPALCQSMGDLYVKQGLLGDALGSYKTGVQLLRQQGRNEDAERLLSRMAAMAPDNASVKINLAELYLAEGKLPAFDAELDRIVLQLRSSGRTGMLLQTLERFRERADRQPAVLERLTQVAESLRRELAEAASAGSQETRPASRSPRREGGSSAEAQPGAGAGPSGSPAKVRASLLEVDLYVKYGLDDKAAERLQELVRAAPESVAVREALRDLCARREDRAGWVHQQLELGRLHRRARNGPEAHRALSAVLQVDPEQAEARRALRELEQEEATWPADEAPPVPDRSVLAEGLPSADPTKVRLVDPSDLLDVSGCLGVEFAQDGIALPGYAEPGESSGFATSELTEVDEIVREFKSGIAEKLATDDYDTHYNLGMAYKEMGLLDEALEEFRIAARSSEKTRETYTCMALVYRETERYGDARAALKMALAATGNTREDEIAILFELGTVAEEEGDWGAALQAFTKAAVIDPSYRDLPGRLQSLQTRSRE